MKQSNNFYHIKIEALLWLIRKNIRAYDKSTEHEGLLRTNSAAILSGPGY
jgi:hypothetical protein